MEWVDQLHGKTVAIDTSPFIFFIEQHARYIHELRSFFSAVDAGEIQLVTSTVTLLEVLVHPLRHKDTSLAQKYNDILLGSRNIATMPVTPLIALTAAQLRAEHNLNTPDAIQLATAIDRQAEVFLTNDRSFPKMQSITVMRLTDIA